VRVLERLGRVDDALALALAASAAPHHESEAQQIDRMLPRLRRAAGLPKPATPRAAQPRTIMLSLRQPAPPLSVEDAVRLHLAAQDPDAQVFYVENTLINSLFGLLCWDVVFAPVPGAFFHPFHVGPADLLSADFLQRRASLFASRMAELENGAYRHTILRRYREKAGLQSPFVFWGALDESLLTMALDCIAPTHLAALFRRIPQNIAANRAGLPDLIQFWPRARRYRMIEVKGPGDRLQDNQIRWLDYCAAHGIPVEVCYVTWRDAAESGA
jgi:hypothetical protein